MEIRIIAIKDIVVDDRYRKDLGDLEELAESIKLLGLMQPIGVSQNGKEYKLVWGERRLRAVQLNGAATIECRVLNLLHFLRHEHDENEMRKSLAPSERVAIAKAVESKYGKRQGQRTDKEDSQLRVNLPEVTNDVIPGDRPRDAAAKAAGFGSEKTYRDAAKVVEQGTPALQAAMDAGTVSISDAAAVASEPAKVQNAAVNAVKAGKAPTARAAVAARKPADDDATREPGVEAPEDAEPVKDAEGETVPDHAIEAFVRADEITKLCREIDGILHRAEEIAKAPGGELIRFESVKQQLKDAKGNLWANRPTHVCPYCHGKKKSKPCECCKDRGWTSKLYWSQAPGNNEKAKR